MTDSDERAGGHRDRPSSSATSQGQPRPAEPNMLEAPEAAAFIPANFHFEEKHLILLLPVNQTWRSQPILSRHI